MPNIRCQGAGRGGRSMKDKKRQDRLVFMTKLDLLFNVFSLPLECCVACTGKQRLFREKATARYLRFSDWCPMPEVPYPVGVVY